MGSKKSSSSAPPAPWTKGYDPSGSGKWKNVAGTMFSKGPKGGMGGRGRGDGAAGAEYALGKAKQEKKKKNPGWWHDDSGPGGGR